MTQANTGADRYAPDLPGEGLPLIAEHKRELFRDSVISTDVAEERGYMSIGRPDQETNFGIRIKGRWFGGNGCSSRDFLSGLGFPSWAIRENYFYTGLWIPQYTPRGEMYAGQWKPRNPIPNKDGKRMKYVSSRGNAVRLDVHPRWSKDRGQEDAALVPWISDPDRRLWITEGVKKADSLTSRDEVTIALSGVFNFRNAHGTLGDWEDVRLRGREIVLCFDADAVSKTQVAQAMARLGKWLVHKGAKKVHYCVVPSEVVTDSGVTATKGVDDFFAAGGTVKQLERVFATKAPKVTDTEDKFTDARLAETLAIEVLEGTFCWAAGLDWLAFDGRRWREVHEVTVLESVRQWALDNHAEAADRLRDKSDATAAFDVDGWRGLLSKNRANSVLAFARGIVEKQAADFDADPELLNTPDGVVHLPTKEVMPHSAEFMMTKITSGSYRAGFTHPDWDRALDVLPADVMEWFRIRVGQAITGYTTPDGIVPIMKGGGENGKGLLMTDGILPAFGDYAAPASPKLFASAKNEHSTERAELRGQRLVIAEELTEGKSIDVTALKQIADVGEITARRTHKDNMRFTASHSIFATTNYTPVIAETDHGTWRRLALVVFPFTFVKPGETIHDPSFELRGDPTLKARIKANKSGQHDAAVTWAVEGAYTWFENMRQIEAGETETSVMLPVETVSGDTLTWRKEADRILGFWEECLIPDPNAVVLASDVTERFNEWLGAGGHSPWAKETFGPRFRDHVETKRHRATFTGRKRIASLAAFIVRRPVPNAFPGTEKALPKQADVWQGFRYRTGAEDV
jgi:P4 family phage/plasmid primase-like protien